MKCANCDREAMYEYKMTQTKSTFYCGKDLPKFLEARKNAGLLTLTPAHADNAASAVTALTTLVPEEEAPAPKKVVKKTAK